MISRMRRATVFWRRFRSHQAGVAALGICVGLFILSLMASVIANDRPLLIHLSTGPHQGWYSPVVRTYPETAFGGVFESEADYRDPAVHQLIVTHGWMLWAPIHYRADTLNLAVPVLSPPSADNWLGTDDQGRDVLARLLYGLRVSIWFGLGLTLAGSVLGMLVGALQGYLGGWVDLIGQRVFEVWGGFPQIFTVMVLSRLLAPSVWSLFMIMMLFGWMNLVSMVRMEFLRARELDYVRAARIAGLGSWTIIYRHILPNIWSSTLAQLPFILIANITGLTTLDFLGYGLPPGSASLGELMVQAKDHLEAPWIGLAAFGTVTLLLASLLLIGEALRDALDSRVQLRAGGR